MALHFPLKKLLAFHDNQLSAAENADIKTHLDTCTFCAENLSLLTHHKPPVKIPPAVGAETAHKTTCPTPEIIGKYITHELPPSEHHELERHLTGCVNCRHQLATILESSSEPVSEDEKRTLAALPPFDISESVQQVISLLPQTATPPSILERLAGWIYPHIPGSDRLRPAWKIALAPAIILLICLAGYQPFRKWQADRHADLAITRLQNAWTITDDDLRPANDFRLSIFSQTHSPEETPGADTVETEFHRALQWDEKNHAARLGLATYRCFTGDWEAADSIITLLIDENAQDFAAWNNRGLITAQREDSTAALAAFERALQIRPDYATAAYNRADLLHRLGRRDQAIQAWQNYLQLDSASEWAEVARRRLRDLGR